jgi:hypothetical protein
VHGSALPKRSQAKLHRRKVAKYRESGEFNFRNFLILAIEKFKKHLILALLI